MIDSTLTTTKQILNGLGDALLYIETKATPLLKMYYEGLVERAIIRGVFEIVTSLALVTISMIMVKCSNKKNLNDGDKQVYLFLSAVLFFSSLWIMYVGVVTITSPEVSAINSIIRMVTDPTSK